MVGVKDLRSAAFKGPPGKIRKKLISITAGRQADANRVALTVNRNSVVARAYAPAPMRPAPPVPLPQAARLKGP